MYIVPVVRCPTWEREMGDRSPLPVLLSDRHLNVIGFLVLLWLAWC